MSRLRPKLSPPAGKITLNAVTAVSRTHSLHVEVDKDKRKFRIQKTVPQQQNKQLPAEDDDLRLTTHAWSSAMQPSRGLQLPLPLEQAAYVLSLLSPLEHVRVEGVCRGWHALLSDEAGWRDLDCDALLSDAASCGLVVADTLPLPLLQGAVAHARGSLRSMRLRRATVDCVSLHTVLLNTCTMERLSVCHLIPRMADALRLTTLPGEPVLRLTNVSLTSSTPLTGQLLAARQPRGSIRLVTDSSSWPTNGNEDGHPPQLPLLGPLLAVNGRGSVEVHISDPSCDHDHENGDWDSRLFLHGSARRAAGV